MDDNMENLTPAQVELMQYGNLAKKLLSDKKTKSNFEKLVKQVAPEVETSEDLAEPLLAPLREQLAAQGAELKNIKDGAVEWNKQEKLLALRKAGYTDEGLAKIQEIAATKGIADLDVAAAYFDKTNPVAKARVDGVSQQNFGNDIFGLQENTAETLDMLFNNTDAFIAQQVNAVSEEFSNKE